MKRSKWIAKHEKARRAAQADAATAAHVAVLAGLDRALEALTSQVVADNAHLREELLTVTREADRLRHGVPVEGDFVCPDALEVVELRTKVARLEDMVVALARHCEVQDKDTEYMEVHGDLLDSMSKQEYADVFRYLAEVGKVEIVIDEGRRVIARWKP